MLIRLAHSLAKMLILPTVALVRCWSGLRSGSLAHGLYLELVDKGMSHAEASRIAADSLHHDLISTGVHARAKRTVTVARSAKLWPCRVSGRSL